MLLISQFTICIKNNNNKKNHEKSPCRLGTPSKSCRSPRSLSMCFSHHRQKVKWSTQVTPLKVEHPKQQDTGHSGRGIDVDIGYKTNKQKIVCSHKKFITSFSLKRKRVAYEGCGLLTRKKKKGGGKRNGSLEVLIFVNPDEIGLTTMRDAM